MPHAQPPAVYQLAPSAIPRCTAKSNVVTQDIGGSVGEAEYDSAADFCTDGSTQYGRVLVHRCDPPLVVIRRKGHLPVCTVNGSPHSRNPFTAPCAPNVVRDNSPAITVEGCGNVVTGNTVEGWPPK